MRYGKTRLTITRTLIATAISACFAPLVLALPVAPVVVNGNATFVQNGNVLTVTNSNQAVINWQSFSIGSSETTKFVQPSASSSVLNRVLSNDPSLLLGSLQSNGRVFLINPAGILVGQGARVDVAGFVASTLNLSDSDFLANRLRFTETPGAGKVQNLGEITTPSGGNVYLVAPQIENNGIINAPNGEVILAAGQRIELVDTATPGVRVEVVGSEGNATNLGNITAEAGRIGIAGVLVKNSGTLNASSVVSEGGRIFLKATTDTLVDGNSQITATGTKGGRIEVLGNRVAVMDKAQLDVSGQAAGGSVLVGGDYQGKNSAIQNAQITYFGPQASIKADAADNGNGGKVIIWSDDTTRAYGNISARGGAKGGNGGFVEVSGKKALAFDARVDTSAPFGLTGTLLLDPFSVTIADGPLTSIGGSSWTESSTASSLSWSSIDTQLQSTNVTITTTDSGGANDDIYFSNAYGPMIASPTATNTLILNANDKVVFNQRVILKGGIDITAGSDVNVNALVRSVGNMTVSAGNDINIGYSGLTGESGFEMANAGGSQTINASNALNLTGTFNPASGVFIKSAGSQSITANAITLTAGVSFPSNTALIQSAGAQVINTTAGDLSLSGSTDAKADISSDTSQTLNIAGNLTLTGGAGASAGGAFIGAPVQDINVGGNLTMNAGSGSTLDAYGMAAPAAIGNDTSSDITLDVGGSITLSGNNATNQAIIGSATGTASIYLRGTDINLGNNSFVGNWDGSLGGSATLIATGTTIQQLANGNIGTGSLTATANTDIVFNGINKVNSVSLDASTGGGLVSYHTANPNTTHIDATAGLNQPITITGDAGSGNIGLGALETSGTGTVTVVAQNSILDDNGTGVANIIRGTGTILLTSQLGAQNASNIAISADLDGGANTINGTVTGGAYGGIRIGWLNAVTAPTSVTLADSSTTAGQGHIGYSSEGDILLNTISATTANGGIGIVAGGNLTVNGGTLSAAAIGESIALFASNNLTVSNTFGASNPIMMYAGGTMDVNAPVTSADSLALEASTLNINANVTGATGLGLFANTLNITGATAQATSGNLYAIADNIVATGGNLWATAAAGDAIAIVTENIKLNNGSSIKAGNDVYLSLTGADSTLYLNETTGGSASYILAGMPNTIHIDFSGRSADGIVIDGVPTTTSLPGGSGLFVVNTATPAIAGAGLEITYGIFDNVAASAITDVADKATDASSIGLSDGGGTTEGTSSDPVTGALADSGSFGDSENGDDPQNPGSNKQGSTNAKTPKKPAQCGAST